MTVVASFRKAERQQVKASIMIEGLQGTGKSGLALAIANTLASKEDKIYAIDTENQSLDLFDGNKLHTGKKIGDFNKVDLTADEGYSPSNYEILRDSAIKAGAEVVILDSISHMWNRKGGMLDLVTQASKSPTGKDFNAWNTDRNVQEKELIFDLIRSNKAHTIVTVRSKEKFALELNEAKGKNEVVSLGEQQIQQDGLKYEPDLVLRMISPGNDKGKAPVALVLKTRYTFLEKDQEYEFTETLLNQLKEYLAEGIDPEKLLQQQVDDYIKAIKEYCGDNKTRKSIWSMIKENFGYAETKINDIPLQDLKKMYAQLASE